MSKIYTFIFNVLASAAFLLLVFMFIPLTHADEPHISNVSIDPPSITKDVRTTITLSANVIDNDGDIRIVKAQQEIGGHFRNLARLRDDGRRGDASARDGIYTGRARIRARTVGNINCRILARDRAKNTTTLTGITIPVTLNKPPSVSNVNTSLKIDGKRGTIVTVTASITDPEGGKTKAALQKKKAGQWKFFTALHDNGRGGDSVAGDGIWTAEFRLPANRADSTTDLRVVASDRAKNASTSTEFSVGQGSGNASATIQEMVDKVQQSDIENYIRTLQNSGKETPDDIGTRSSYTQGLTQAADFIAQEFGNFGLQVERQEFFLPSISLESPSTGDIGDGVTVANIIGTLTGTKTPEQIYVICAHYDSTSLNNIEDPFDILKILAPEPDAPGADDNASGTAGVLLTAKILSQYHFESTIRFVLFAAEEQGLVGSDVYTKEVYYDDTGEVDELGQPILVPNPEDIRGALNLDMIAYYDGKPAGGEDLDIIAYDGATYSITEWPKLRDYVASVVEDPSMIDTVIQILENSIPPPVAEEVHCQTLLNKFVAAAQTYNTGLKAKTVVGGNAEDWWAMGASDHFNFWWYGYPALLLIDDVDLVTSSPTYPYYHSSNDLLKNLTALDMAVATVKTSVATLADLAVPAQ